MRIKKGYLLRLVGNQNVVVAIGEESLKFNGMLRLNQSATYMWQLLIEGSSEEELIRAVHDRYDADIDMIKKDVTQFIAKLQEAKVIEDL